MNWLLLSTILTGIFFIVAFILVVKLYLLSAAWRMAWLSYLIAVVLCIIRTIYNVLYLVGFFPYILNIIISMNIAIAFSVMLFNWYLWRIFSKYLTSNSWKK